MDKIDFIYISNEKFKEIGNAFDELYLNEPIKVNTYISQGELAFKHCYFVLVGVQGNLWQLEMSWSQDFLIEPNLSSTLFPRSLILSINK